MTPDLSRKSAKVKNQSSAEGKIILPCMKENLATGSFASEKLEHIAWQRIFVLFPSEWGSLKNILWVLKYWKLQILDISVVYRKKDKLDFCRR